MTAGATPSALVAEGRARIEWAHGQMPVLRSIRERLAAERPLGGLRVGACLHVTAETACLVQALAAGGAEGVLCAANPLTTQDDVAAALREEGCATHGRRGEDADAYVEGIVAVVGERAQVIVCEIDPMRALEARMEGFEVMPARVAAERGDVFVTVTGSRDVLGAEHFARMKDGAVLANAGHFDVEIDLDALRAAADGDPRPVLPLVDQ